MICNAAALRSACSISKNLFVVSKASKQAKTLSLTQMPFTLILLTVFSSRGGALRTQKLMSLWVFENSELTNVLPLKSGVGQNIYS